MDNELINLAAELGSRLQKKHAMLTVAESCTGGGICQLLTSCAGSSRWFDCGFISYSNNSKMQMLGLKADTLKAFGAVSRETAIEMAQGALQHSAADYAISVTGIAGPDGGSKEKPVGTVFMALESAGQSICYEEHFNGARDEVRQQAIKFALQALLKRVAD